MIVVCGESLIDFLPVSVDAGETAYRPFPGGSPYNVAIATARLDAPTAFLGKISSDAFGDLLAGTLSQNGVDLRWLARGPELTTLAFVTAAPGEEPRYAFYAEGAADRMVAETDIPDTFPPDVTCLHVGFGAVTPDVDPVSRRWEALADREADQRIVSFDPNVRPNMVADKQAYLKRLEGWVDRATMIKVSSADLRWLYPGTAPERAAETWCGRGPKLVVMTRGAYGAMAWGHRVEAEVNGARVEVVDTVGAGDTFQGALLVGLAERGLLTRDGLDSATKGDLEDVMGFATRAAAVNCTRAGMDPPRRSELR